MYANGPNGPDKYMLAETAKELSEQLQVALFARTAVRITTSQGAIECIPWKIYHSESEVVAATRFQPKVGFITLHVPDDNTLPAYAEIRWTAETADDGTDPGD